VIVLFGGTAGGNETWEWNGAGAGAWTQRAVSGPSSRDSHAMAYDAARAVTVLFGGFNGSAFNAETWEWNGTVWTQRIVGGPSPRREHAMAYDVARNVTILFAGLTGEGIFNDETWVLGVLGCPGRKGDFDHDNAVTPGDILGFVSVLLTGPADPVAACQSDM